MHLSEREADIACPYSTEVINVCSALHGLSHTSLNYAGIQGHYHISIATYSRKKKSPFFWDVTQYIIR